MGRGGVRDGSGMGRGGSGSVVVGARDDSLGADRVARHRGDGQEELLSLPERLLWSVVPLDQLDVLRGR